MSIDEILEELENLLIDASRVPFTNKRIVEEDDLARIIDDLREALPSDIAEAKRIISERKRILDDAHKEGQNIIDQAKNYVMKLTDENVITQQAQESASGIIAEAQKSARSLQSDAVGYADDVFKHLEANLERALEVVRAGHNELYQQSQQNQKNQAS
ncbi:MAG: ATP synthase F0 subunit B [Veillonellaceae bacterium]|jgi:vacuolar-type H+-ATPase subunit H|nr:ATP synthase F0 subunit B [Veillonellaceae bacterium]